MVLIYEVSPVRCLAPIGVALRPDQDRVVTDIQGELGLEFQFADVPGPLQQLQFFVSPALSGGIESDSVIGGGRIPKSIPWFIAQCFAFAQMS